MPGGDVPLTASSGLGGGRLLAPHTRHAWKHTKYNQCGGRWRPAGAVDPTWTRCFVSCLISSGHLSAGRVSPLAFDGLVCGGGSRRRRNPADGHHLPRSGRPRPRARPRRADGAAHCNTGGDALLPVSPDPGRQGRGTPAELPRRADRRLAQHADYRLGNSSRGAFVKQTFGQGCTAASRPCPSASFSVPSISHRRQHDWRRRTI